MTKLLRITGTAIQTAAIYLFELGNMVESYAEMREGLKSSGVPTKGWLAILPREINDG